MFPRLTILTLAFATGTLTVQSGSGAWASEYLVTGVRLYQDVIDTRLYRTMKCSPSKLFAGNTWCFQVSRGQGRYGRHVIVSSLLHSSDRRALYVSRSVKPAYFKLDEVKSEIARLSKRYGVPRLLVAPRNMRPYSGIIASWGNVRLVPLSDSSRATIAMGGSSKEGLLVDFLGDIRKSARTGLPVYALRGGAGFVWSASFDQSGIGSLRFTTADPSSYMPSLYGQSVAKASPPPIVPYENKSKVQAPVAKKKSSSGTGFFVNVGGMVLTNAHVVAGCSEIKVRTSGVPENPATVVARDNRNDLAILKVGVKPNAIAVFRTGLKLGEPIAAFGYPLSSLLSSSGNFTLGNVTSLAGVADDTRMVQISSPVQAGNSGGPVLDQNGNVVGVVTSKLNVFKTAALTGDIPQNVNFAVKAAIIANFLDSNGIAYEKVAKDKTLLVTELAERAKEISVYISCN
jgi:hypothetical protein